MLVVEEQWPFCAVCNKPVERVEIDNGYDVAFRRETRWRVHCHGEVEQFEVEESLLLEATSITIGKAFRQGATKELPP